MGKKRTGAATRRVSTPLKWHGGKHYLAPQVVAMMPPHETYVEPYFGGGSVLLAKGGEEVSEVANDLNSHLTNFWRVLQGEESFALFRRRLEATPFSEWEWNQANRKLLLDDVDVAHACAFFTQCRQSLAGRMKQFAALTKTRRRRGMNEQVSAWLSCVKGLPAVHERLKRVLVLNRDALKVVREFDAPGTAFYLDPPYLHETRASTGEYAFEMTDADHEALLAALSKLKGRFLLSGYRSKMYDEAAARYGWQAREFDLPNNSAGGKAKERRTEVVWTNYHVTPPLPGTV